MRPLHHGSWTVLLVWISAISVLVLWVAWRWQAHRMHWIREWPWGSSSRNVFAGGMREWADINDAADKEEARVSAQE